MSAYNLSEEWTKIDENEGYLHNTSQQNIEYIVVSDGVEPPKNSGKVLMPRNWHTFNIPTGKAMYVRVFREMPSGYIPTVSVNSTADLNRREDNELEGSTNCLTIGISVWAQSSWYPLGWCVIAEDALWQCIQEHKPSTEFLSDVALGRWKILSADGSFLSTLTFNNDGTVTITRGNGTQTVTAISATNDGNGNNIVNTYMTIAAVNDALANYATTSSVNSAINSVNTNIGRINTALGQAQSSLNALANSAIKNITKKNDYTITVTKGDNSATDITLGTLTYVSVSDLVTALAPYSKTSDLNSAISTVNGTIASNKSAIESSLSGAVDTLNDTIASNKSAIESSLSGAVDTLNGTIASNKSAIESSLSGAVNTLNNTIANNKSALQAAIDDVEANTVTNVSADATSIKQTKGNGTTSTVLTIDTDLNTSSTNPVQNKAIANKVNDLQASIDEIGITGNCTITVVGGVQNNIGTFTGVQGRIYILDGNNVRYGNNTIKVAYGSTIIVAVVIIRTGDVNEDVVKGGYFPVEISFQKSALQVSMRDFFPGQSNIFNTNITSRLGLEDNAQATVSYAVHVTENITITGSAMVNTTETGGNSSH